MEAEQIRTVRKGLAVTGDLPSGASEKSRAFDASLEGAVRHFLYRHRLAVHGVVGPDTRGAMNGPVEDRVRQIEVNLERIRWLPEDLGSPHVVVNIPAFRARVVNTRETALSMDVVVGMSSRPTPVFSDQISYLVLNPYWYVPASVAVLDFLPRSNGIPN